MRDIISAFAVIFIMRGEEKMSITTVIRNGRGGRNQSTPSKVQTLLRSGGLDTNRHIVSHTPITYQR